MTLSHSNFALEMHGTFRLLIVGEVGARNGYDIEGVTTPCRISNPVLFMLSIATFRGMFPLIRSVCWFQIFRAYFTGCCLEKKVFP